MKDELGSRLLKSACLLKSKSYALKIQGETDKKGKIKNRLKTVEKTTGKGVKECVRQRHLAFDTYVKALNLTTQEKSEKNSLLLSERKQCNSVRFCWFS